MFLFIGMMAILNITCEIGLFDGLIIWAVQGNNAKSFRLLVLLLMASATYPLEL